MTSLMDISLTTCHHCYYHYYYYYYCYCYNINNQQFSELKNVKRALNNVVKKFVKSLSAVSCWETDMKYNFSSNNKASSSTSCNDGSIWR